MNIPFFSGIYSQYMNCLIPSPLPFQSSDAELVSFIADRQWADSGNNVTMPENESNREKQQSVQHRIQYEGEKKNPYKLSTFFFML